MKYNYVIIQGDTDYYRLITEQTAINREAIVINGLFDVRSKLMKSVLSRVVNVCMKTKAYAFIRVLAPLMFHRKMPKDKPVCFLIMGWYANVVHAGFGVYLRKHYPRCKLVCRFEDIIEKMPYRNIEEYRGSFDLLQSFDPGEAKKHNIDYFPSWYDKSVSVKEEKGQILYDVCFVGRGKDRLNDIFAAYEKFTSAGAKCFFYLVDVPFDRRRFSDSIVYGDYLPYTEVINKLLQSNAVLEILQQDAESETLRVYEALTYKKKLVTNNTHIVEKAYYSSKIINTYKDVSEIDADFVMRAPDANDFDELFINRFKPINRLLYLDRKLSD